MRQVIVNWLQINNVVFSTSPVVVKLREDASDIPKYEAFINFFSLLTKLKIEFVTSQNHIVPFWIRNGPNYKQLYRRSQEFLP